MPDLQWNDYGGVEGYWLKGEVSEKEFQEAWQTYFGKQAPELILKNLEVKWVRKVPDNSGEFGYYMHKAAPNSRGAFQITEVMPFKLNLPEED